MGTALCAGIERGTAVEPVTLPPGVAVRTMRPEDVDAVVSIESEAFTSPWKRETFLGLLDRDQVELLVVTLEGDGVIGYAVLWCILDQGELANVALKPSERGRGLGSQLVERVIELGRDRGIETLYLEVRASNARAISLYGRLGFEEVGRRNGYYSSPREDALVMMRRLT